jgi:hypothetical protein
MQLRNSRVFQDVLFSDFKALAAMGVLGGVLAGCGASQSDGSGNGNGDGGANSGPGFEVPGAGDAGLLPPPGGGGASGSAGGPTGTDQKNCGLVTVPLERLPAELLLVLDRSTSMITEMGAGGQTNWTILTKSVDTTIKNTQAGVLWGLKTFPTTSGCTVRPGVEHDVLINNYTPISGTIMQGRPGNSNGTPTTLAMNAATAYLKGHATPNPKYLLLATDGEPTCFNGNASREATDIPGAVASIDAAAKAGFPTFVVGVAPQRQSGRALDTLNKMAVAGGQPRAGDTKFFSVTSEAELTAALGAIAGQIGSCSFNLSKMPPSPDDVAVDIDGKRIAQSPVSGWQYNATKTAIVLGGVLCDDAKAGKLKSVKITFGCPGMVIPVL